MEIKFIEDFVTDLLNPKQQINSYPFSTPSSPSSRSRSFTVTTYDSKTLSISLLNNNKNVYLPKRCVIYTHSHGANKEEGLQLQAGCHSLGFSLCTYDSRGCGRSSESKITFGHHERMDLLYVLFFVLVTEEIEQFVLWGRSIGCCAVVQLLVRLKEVGKGGVGFLQTAFEGFLKKNRELVMLTPSLKLDILGVVLDCPIKRLQSAILNFIKMKIVNVNFIASYASQYVSSSIQRQLGQGIKHEDNIDLVRIINPNTVLLFSKNDEFVSVNDRKELVDAFMSSCQKKNPKEIFSLNKSHRAKRNLNDVKSALEKLILNSRLSSFSYSFRLHNTFDLNKIKRGLHNSIKRQEEKKSSFVGFNKRGSYVKESVRNFSRKRKTKINNNTRDKIRKEYQLPYSNVSKKQRERIPMKQLIKGKRNPLNFQIVNSDISRSKIATKYNEKTDGFAKTLNSTRFTDRVNNETDRDFEDKYQSNKVTLSGFANYKKNRKELEETKISQFDVNQLLGRFRSVDRTSNKEETSHQKQNRRTLNRETPFNRKIQMFFKGSR